MKISYKHLASILLVALLAPLGALAAPVAEGFSFAPSETDTSMKVLQQILGDWSQGSMNFMTPLFAEAIRLFNMGVLVFGTAIFAYTALVGTLQSAHDGQVLGKQWSTMWVPIRFSLGTALLFPTGTGLNLAQIGMLWLLAQGVGLASTVWSGAVDKHVDSGSAFVAVKSAQQSKVSEVLFDMQMAEMCVAALNKRDQEGQEKYGPQLYVPGSGTGGIYRDLVPDGLDSIRPANAKVVWGAKDGSNRDQCGSLEVADLSKADQAALDLYRLQYRALFSSRYSLAFNADQFINHDPTEPLPPTQMISDSVDSAVRGYVSMVAQQIDHEARVVNAEMIDGMRARAENEGWFTAGTWYFQMARVNEKLNTFANDTPKMGATRLATVSTDAMVGSLNEEERALIVSLVESARARYEDKNRSIMEMMSRGVETGGADGEGSDKLNIYSMAGLRNISNYLMGVDSDYKDDMALSFGYDPDKPAPAIVQLSNIGHYIIGVSEGVMAAGSAVGITGAVSSTASNLIENIPMPQSKIGKLIVEAFAKIGAALMFVGIALLAFGIILAFWLPMLPFINWIGGIIGWAISSLEMLVATPVWLAAHLSPEGDGVASRHAASGYMVILELLLRPVLMVFGLIVAIVIADPLLNVISWMFFPAFQTAIEGSFAGVVAFLMKLVIYVTLCWMAINMTFRAITSVPNGVMGWIGGQRGNNMEMAENLGDNSRLVVTSAIHQGAGAVRALGANRSSAKITQALQK